MIAGKLGVFLSATSMTVSKSPQVKHAEQVLELEVDGASLVEFEEADMMSDFGMKRHHARAIVRRSAGPASAATHGLLHAAATIASTSADEPST